MNRRQIDELEALRPFLREIGCSALEENPTFDDSVEARVVLERRWAAAGLIIGIIENMFHRTLLATTELRDNPDMPLMVRLESLGNSIANALSNRLLPSWPHARMLLQDARAAFGFEEWFKSMNCRVVPQATAQSTQ